MVEVVEGALRDAVVVDLAVGNSAELLELPSPLEHAESSLATSKALPARPEGHGPDSVPLAGGTEASFLASAHHVALCDHESIV
jgi:hypothetical protein